MAFCACRKAARRPPWPAWRPSPPPSQGAQREAKADEGDAPADVEVDLGEFSVTAFQPASNMTLRIDFHLFGSVSAENEKEFRRLLDENKHRFREQVLVTVRSAE